MCHVCSGSVLCSWTGYSENIVQKVPCFPAGLGPPAAPAAAGAPVLLPRVPPGYLVPDTGTAGVRTSWTSEHTRTPASTWVTDSAFKFSAAEMLARGNAGEEVHGQVWRVTYPTIHCLVTPRSRACASGSPRWSTVSKYAAVIVGGGAHPCTIPWEAQTTAREPG